MPFHTLTIVGVGLIGGSIGLAAKQRGAAARVIGVGRDVTRLELARTLGAIDEVEPELAKGVALADLVVFCTPVNCIADEILQAARHCKADAILTDAGSTKAEIVQFVETNPAVSKRFVGGHPLAGSEKKGVEHARCDLFVDRWTVLTPTDTTPAHVCESVRAFWQSLGARVRMMRPDDHDQALALTSHLPHLVAAALAGLLPDGLTDLTATGFRDTTRIARGDPDLWTPILQQNSVAILAALDRLEERLRSFRAAVAMKDAERIDSLLTQGKKVRDALGG
jgi:prephenate dehydrogenase